MKKKVLVCVGTRPNLIKITQLEKAFKEYPNLEYALLHTGQHYDEQMNEIFFNQLKIKKPDYQFKLQSTSQIEQIAEIMVKFESVCRELNPDLVMVPGDVNSSFACAFVANRLQIPVAHIESGLRSFDHTMPEEINRILIDKMSQLHFVTEESGLRNLKNEGHSNDSIRFVGNSMIDSLISFMPHIDQCTISAQLDLDKGNYILATFHRPVNVDSSENLAKIVTVIHNALQFGQVVFPIHPRTRQNLDKFSINLDVSNPDLILTDPLGYFDFLHLVKNAKIVLTDSGGVQEETTFLQVPCLTVRPNTERPITLDVGTNKLVPLDVEIIDQAIKKMNDEKYTSQIPTLWDGHSSERIIEEVHIFLSSQKIT
jgi:UDP-N-acetylglucosamine 2-epimerase (non-hydrolysing)